jgi:hypothetical protein
VEPRACLDDMEKRKLILDPTVIRTPTPGRPARSRSLYRLSYLGSRIKYVYYENFSRVVSPPPRQPRLEPLSGYMGIVVYNVSLGQVFAECFRLSSTS